MCATCPATSAPRPAKPKETPWLEWRDWGSRTLPQYKLWWEPDPGVMLAAGFAHQTWGFRRFPYSTLQTVQLQYSLGRSDFKFNYDGEFRRENSKHYIVLDTQASQLENRQQKADVELVAGSCPSRLNVIGMNAPAIPAMVIEAIMARPMTSASPTDLLHR